MGRSQSRADPSGVYGIGQADALAVTVGCAIGVSGMLVVLAANTCQPLLQQPPARFVRARTTFTLLHATFLMTYASWVLATDNYDGSASQDRSCCGDGGSCADFHAASHTVSDTLETGIVLWQLVMAVDILMIVRDPFAPNRHLRKCAAFAFVGTLIGPAIMLWVHTAKMASLQSGSGESHDCPFANTLSDARFAISFLDLLVIFFATACTVLLVMRLRTGLIISQRSRHRVTRQLLVYNIGYAVADATSLGFNLLGSRSGVRFTILALRGGWDFAVWIVANHNVLFPRGCCRETLPTLPGVEMRTPFGPSPNCSFSSGSGIGVGSMDFGGRGTDWERASQLEDVPQTGERPAGTPVPLEKLDIAEELRYELVLLTAHGIGECTSDNWQQSVSTHRSSARSAHKGDGRRCGWSNRREERVQISPSSSCKEHENDETVRTHQMCAHLKVG
ncbi:hypothetical protein AB1Y20_019310 [Prymnesium parvum]|uniref:G-protein coupled receptors family 1 profile domain-containing protein n=1 Tax=Prymnesium parvum TaxID=97485 RepID=A0AB34JRE6_PRYPA